jgi:hypothetical protein
VSLLSILLVLHVDFGSVRMVALFALTIPFALIGRVASVFLTGGVPSLGSISAPAAHTDAKGSAPADFAWRPHARDETSSRLRFPGLVGFCYLRPCWRVRYSCVR